MHVGRFRAFLVVYSTPGAAGSSEGQDLGLIANWSFIFPFMQVSVNKTVSMTRESRRAANELNDLQFGGEAELGGDEQSTRGRGDTWTPGTGGLATYNSTPISAAESPPTPEFDFSCLPHSHIYTFSSATLCDALRRPS